MPTKYQAQVKMTPKVKPSQVRRDVAAMAPTSNAGATANRAKSAPVRPLKPVSYSSSEARFALAPQAWAPGIGYEIAKRALDVALGLVLLVVATPIILVAALAIRLETKGSPFFIQTRLGKNGKPFRIVKLRGMFIDARSRFASYYDYSNHRGFGILLPSRGRPPCHPRRQVHQEDQHRRTSQSVERGLGRHVTGRTPSRDTRSPGTVRTRPGGVPVGQAGTDVPFQVHRARPTYEARDDRPRYRFTFETEASAAT